MADFILGRLKFVWKGEWATSTNYVKDDVVEHDGQSWACVDVHESSADFYTDKSTKWELMAGGVSYKGNWNSGTTYGANNLVTYAGSTWISAQDNNTNQTPTSGSSVWWVIFSQGAIELTTVGDLLYRETAAPSRLAIGSENSVLQVSASGRPEWVTNVDIPGNLGLGNSLTVTGSGSIGSTFGVTGNTTLTGDLAVNGGDVTSTATTFNLLNATVTTLNVGGAASVNIGSGAGITTIGNDIDVNGTLYQGVNPIAQETTDGLTDAVAILIGNVNAFSQVAHKNINDGTGASTDFIAYADNGDNDSGWIDMGITSSTFDDPAFGVTGINDGYIFMSAPDLVTPLGNGNLYISTSGNGLQNDIVFSTGGFEDNTYERMRIVGVAHGSYNAGINLVDDLSTSTGNFYIGPNAKALTVDGTTATTQLDGGINSTATTITVDSTTGFNTKGYITINSEVIYYGGKTSTTFTNCNRGYQGTTAASHLDNDAVEQVTYVGLTNATAIYTGDADDFVQFSIKNTNSGASASTDLIAYASDGDNDSGWIDLGITSATYSDPAFTVTGPGTGYLFFSAPATTTGTGDLLIGTDHTGSNNDIVFFTNGFDAGNERLRIVGQGVNAGVEVYADTESTSTTTGALRVEGGIGLQGNLYVGGDVNIVGNITLGGTGNTVETESLAVADPIIRMANGNSASDSVDIGFVGTYGSSGAKYTGLVRDASDGLYKLFTGMTANPTTTVDFTGATYADLRLNNLDFTTAGKIKINGSAGTDGKFLKTTSNGMEWADAAVTVSDSTTNSSFYPLFTTATSGTVTTASVSSTRFSFNPSTGALAVKGSLALQGSTSGAVTFQAPATAGSATYTLPSADGSSGQALVTNGSGTLSWGSAGASIATTSTNATFYPVFASSSSGSLTTANVNTGFTYNASTGLLTVTNITESSSIALKDNIAPITNALDAVLKLVGVTYDRKDGTKQNEAGLIAESVNLVLPNLVSKDEQGNPDGIHYSKLTAYLIEAIKSMDGTIKTLTNRLEQLEGNK